MTARPPTSQGIAELYGQQANMSLEDAVKDDLSGDYKDMILMKIRGQAKIDAEVLWDALDGLGTDEERLNEILTTRNPGQVKEMAREYPLLLKNKSGRSLWDHVCGDTTFKYERLLKAKIDPAGMLAFSMCDPGALSAGRA